MAHHDDKDRRLKQSIADELLQEQRRHARELSAMRRQASHEKATVYANEQWAKVEENAQNLLKDRQYGYDQFHTAMSQLCIYCLDLARALHASNPVGSLLIQVGEQVALPIGYRIKDSITDRLSKSSNDPLPVVIQNSVTFRHNEQRNCDELDVSAIQRNLVRSDGKPISQEQMLMFLGGVTAWLNIRGYHADTRENHQYQYLDAQNNPLTVETFNQLRDDPEHGLQKFLSGHFDMEFEQHLAPSP